MIEENEVEKPKDTENKTVLSIYGSLAAALVLSVVPNTILMIIGSILFIVTMSKAYKLRRNAEPDDLIGNHMTYLIRTVWIGSLFFLIAIAIASIYIINNMDYSAINVCINAILGSGGSIDMNMVALQNCQIDFIAGNNTVLINGMVISAFPILIYFSVRFFKGLRRASDGYRMANPKAWF